MKTSISGHAYSRMFVSRCPTFDAQESDTSNLPPARPREYLVELRYCEYRGLVAMAIHYKVELAVGPSIFNRLGSCLMICPTRRCFILTATKVMLMTCQKQTVALSHR